MFTLSDQLAMTKIICIIIKLKTTTTKINQRAIPTFKMFEIIMFLATIHTPESCEENIKKCS